EHPEFRFSEPQPGKRLKVGYLSADYRQHILGDMIWQLFRWHDRSRFEIFAYATNADDGSPHYRKFSQDAANFRDLSQISCLEAARRIHADGIDLLVFLGGYTEGDRTEILALHPAPLQIAYLDYPASLGADWIEYVISDQNVTPEALAPWFSEKFVWLPHSYQLNNDQLPLPRQPLTRAEVELPQDAFVYSCFNKVNRISPDLFACWMRILAQVPHSVLWLLRQNEQTEANLKRNARAAGIDPERVIFAPYAPKPRHIARQACADLFLDTLYTNGHTTSTDALWAGVPVLSLPGETFTSRVGSSLLHAVGLPELLVDSLAAYEETAVALASEPGRLKTAQDYLRGPGRQSPLFNTRLTLQHLEAAYELIWKRHCQGLPPALLQVAASEAVPQKSLYEPIDAELAKALHEVDSLGQQGRFTEVIGRCRELLASAPEQAKALHLLGLALMMSGQPAEALAPLQQAREHCPETADIWKHLGLAQCQLGDVAAGAASLAQAVRLQPDALDTLFNLGLAQLRLQQPAAAIDSFQALLRLAPEHAPALLQLGHAYLVQQRPDLARASYREALRLQPGNPAVQRALEQLSG
ncbi:MAG: tetratricopeptide repeat protein, partial [Candidatus Sericytochromatia bacterium]